MRQIPLSGIALLLVSCFPATAQRPGGGPGPKSTGLSRSNRPITTGTGSLPTTTHFNANQEAKVEFRSQTVLVQVPVVVLDKKGNHVHGLAKDDFEVLESGKPKTITSFEEINTSSQAIASNKGTPDTFINTGGASGHSAAPTVIVLDTINTPYLDQAYGRKELIRYLASNLNAGQSFALVILTSNGVRIIHQPTQDASGVVQALKKLSGELPAMQGVDIDAQAIAATSSPEEEGFASALGRGPQDPYVGLEEFIARGDSSIVRLQQDRAIEATLHGFLDIAWSLSGVPGRKSLVWATGSFPFEIGSSGEVPGGYQSVLYEHAMKALNDAQIAVYPVDIRGLVNTNPASDAGARMTRSPAGSARQVFARDWLQNSSIDTLKDFAEMTGGRAFYNTNDLAGSFHRAAEDSSSYYLLAYYLDTENRDPGWRKLKVKVARKDIEVRSRSGFFVTNATNNPETSRKLDLGLAANSPFDSTGLPMTVQWTAVKSVPDSKAPNQAGKKTVQFLVRVAGSGVTVNTAEKNHVDLDVLAFAFTGKGKESAANFAQNLAMSIPEEQLAKLREQGVGYRNALELPSGNYFVRFIVRDNVSGHVGSVSAPLTVN
ncbi:MAG TPA: VWA domain-containing protein [Terriglobales bacterium]|jgi:VWFA-related protein|nr:VWA domain-containing protein [Terriglobales bacterium]